MAQEPTQDDDDHSSEILARADALLARHRRPTPGLPTDAAAITPIPPPQGAHEVEVISDTPTAEGIVVADDDVPELTDVVLFTPMKPVAIISR